MISSGDCRPEALFVGRIRRVRLTGPHRRRPLEGVDVRPGVRVTRSRRSGTYVARSKSSRRARSSRDGTGPSRSRAFPVRAVTVEHRFARVVAVMTTSAPSIAAAGDSTAATVGSSASFISAAKDSRLSAVGDHLKRSKSRTVAVDGPGRGPVRRCR